MHHRREVGFTFKSKNILDTRTNHNFVRFFPFSIKYNNYFWDDPFSYVGYSKIYSLDFIQMANLNHLLSLFKRSRVLCIAQDKKDIINYILNYSNSDVFLLDEQKSSNKRIRYLKPKSKVSLVLALQKDNKTMLTPYFQVTIMFQYLQKGGDFLLRIYDTISFQSVYLIYFLLLHFSEIAIVKPCSSHIANTEMFLYCVNMKKIPSKNDLSWLYDTIVACTKEEQYQFDPHFAKQMLEFNLDYYDDCQNMLRLTEEEKTELCNKCLKSWGIY